MAEDTNARSEYMAYLRMKYEQWEQYHDHKENSAWATTALYVGAAGFVCFGKPSIFALPVKPLPIILAVVVLLGFVVAGWMVFWQLSKRRMAVIRHGKWQKLLTVELQRLLDGRAKTTVNLKDDSKAEQKRQQDIYAGRRKGDDGKKEYRFVGGGVLVGLLVGIAGLLVLTWIVAWFVECPVLSV